MIDFKEPVIYNAKVKYSYLGLDDNNKLYFQLGFDYEHNSQANTGKQYINDIEIIKKIITVLDLKSWEEVARKFARIKVIDSRVISIGNLIDNRWVEVK